jgi:hypothetical protein
MQEVAAAVLLQVVLVELVELVVVAMVLQMALQMVGLDL